MEPYVGEIRLFAGTFAPSHWRFCDGSLLPIAQYDSLYSLIGTLYGGDGRTTFRLPDLRGRVMIGHGAGPGLTARAIADAGGASAVRLEEANLPSHCHTVTASNQGGGSSTFQGHYPTLANMAPFPPGTVAAYTDKAVAAAKPILTFAEGTIRSSGSGGFHWNVMPCMGLCYIIATQGIFPPLPDDRLLSEGEDKNG